MKTLKRGRRGFGFVRMHAHGDVHTFFQWVFPLLLKS